MDLLNAVVLVGIVGIRSGNGVGLGVDADHLEIDGHAVNADSGRDVRDGFARDGIWPRLVGRASAYGADFTAVLHRRLRGDAGCSP